MSASPPLGASIRAAYRATGLNRAQFQRALGVAYSTVLSWERGDTRPNAAHLERIAEVTGIGLSDLLRGELATRAGPSSRTRHAAYDRFLRLEGTKLTAAERTTIESITFVGIEPTVATFVAILCGLRMGRNGVHAKRPRRTP